MQRFTKPPREISCGFKSYILRLIGEGMGTGLWFLSILVCMVLASDKHKDVGLAFFAGLIFGWFAVLYYFFCEEEYESTANR